MSMFGDQVSSVAVPLTAVLVLHARAYEMGVPHRAAVAAEPAVRTARRGLGRPAGQAARRHDPRRHRPRRWRSRRSGVLRAARADLRQMCAVTFVAGLAFRAVHRVRRDAVRVDRGVGGYVDGQSLIYGSRALSFFGGPSVGGLLVQALSGPYAIVVDALSFLGSAFQLGLDPAEGAARRRRRRRPHRRAAVHRRLPDRPGVADRSGGGQLLQPDVRGAVHAVRGEQLARSKPGLLGAVIGAAAVGGILGSLLCKRLTDAARRRARLRGGCLVFTVPLALVRSPRRGPARSPW